MQIYFSTSLIPRTGLSALVINSNDLIMQFKMVTMIGQFSTGIELGLEMKTNHWVGTQLASSANLLINGKAMTRIDW